MKSVFHFPVRPFAFLLLTLALSACGGSDQTELRSWMAQEQKLVKPGVAKISPPKVYVPLAYAGKDEIDPFDPAKLLIVLARMRAESNNGIKPNPERPREALEAFPLDSLKMVGTIEKNKMTFGLVQVDKTVYQVKLGGYLGQHEGLITNISENAIDIKEIVQDAAGSEWAYHEAKLELQEAQK